jgi:type VI secretion system secreted protein VgrG
VDFPGGITRTGTLDGAGRAVLTDVPAGTGQVRFGSMPGKYARKDLRPTPNHNPKPNQGSIDALIDKYGSSQNSGEV